MKKRLDILVAEKESISREKAQALIMAGEVFVCGQKATKVGTSFDETLEIEVKGKMPYVSRGALKLEHAAKEFGLDFKGKIICDVGTSTGGFTDFCLQQGTTRVYAVDTGKGQIAQKLREDKKVILFENTNIKNVESLPEPIDFFVVDVSFISLKQVLPVLKKIIGHSSLEISHSCNVIALIKPQFEVGKEIADKTRGVIRDDETRLKVVHEIGEFAEGIGYHVQGITESPITGAKGNKEYLIYLT